MQIRFSLDITRSYNPSERGGAMTWENDAYSAWNQKNIQKTKNDDLVRQRNELLASQAQGRWQDLRTSFQSHCQKFNEVAGTEVLFTSITGDNKIEIRMTGALLEASYNPKTREINIFSRGVPKCDGKYVVDIVTMHSKDKVAITSSPGGIPSIESPDEIAQSVLSAFIAA